MVNTQARAVPGSNMAQTHTIPATAQEQTSGDSKRNLRLLVGAQSLGGASPPIIISLGGLVGQALTDTPALATLPVSLFNLGLALSTIPAALLMRSKGRRTAYLTGAAMGLASGLVAALGIHLADFWLFCTGTALAGFYAACVQSYRFAASDSVPAPDRSRAISLIMVGGLFAAIIGPQVVIWTRDLAWFAHAPFTGSFLGQGVLALLAIPLIASLKMPRPQAQAADGQGQGRPLREIARMPRFVAAVTAGVVSYGLMAFIMTAAPVAMVGHGHTAGDAALGIQWHVLAMYAPSFFTGRLIARFGELRITALGLVLIAASGLVALQGGMLWSFWGSLILLGVGWNFGFIGATAMVADCYSPEERAKVQALNDFLVFGTVAAASFGSGGLLLASGWNTINLAMQPIVAATLVLLAWHAWRREPATAAS